LEWVEVLVVDLIICLGHVGLNCADDALDTSLKEQMLHPHIFLMLQVEFMAHLLGVGSLAFALVSEA